MKDHGIMPEFVNWVKQYGGHPLPKWNDDINIVGIRNEADQKRDIFNDKILLVMGNKVLSFTGTTDPGKYWTKNAKSLWGVSGVAHLVEGWYPETYQLGYHFKELALVQTGAPVTVWRDVDEDYKYDTDIDEMQTGYFSINIHYTKNGPILIGQWSGGCQVIQNRNDWELFINLCKKFNPGKFNYLLMNINDLNEKYYDEFFKAA